MVNDCVLDKAIIFELGYQNEVLILPEILVENID
jgi:hypothetical protein